MSLVAMLRVKNEARWIRAVLRSALAVCECVYVLDDHSTDETAEICRSFGETTEDAWHRSRLRVYNSPFSGLDETRDKNWLLGIVRLAGAEWILAIDGDEVLMEEDHAALLSLVRNGSSPCYALRVLYLWDRPNQIRTDGVYGRFWRPSLFRLRPGDTFRSTPNGGNFHCGNVPKELLGGAQRCDVRLMHFGYMDAQDRRRKFDWYNQHDPANQVEDCYRHIVQGDPGGFPADLHLRHAGPLVLAPLEPLRENATA
jgi:glycosyltransferase involved in cell wall biosynthesis